MSIPSTTQSKRRQLFTVMLGAILLPALVAVLLPSTGSQETIVATAPLSALDDPSSTTTEAPPSSMVTTTTTEAPTVEPSTTEAPITTTTVVKMTTTTVPPTTAPPTTAAAKKQAPVYVAPTTTAPPYKPPPTTAPAPSGDAAAWSFLACVKQRESGGNYSIVSSNGLWRGAYQFDTQAWNSTAAHAGRTDLIGVPANQASPADQDAMALALYYWQGKTPWYHPNGSC